MPPVEVAVATPLQRTIIEYDEFTGRFEPSRTVEIRPRVSGQLRAVHFRDGDYVRQGQLLFTIDPRPFQAALAEAQARAAAARAAASLAAVQLARAQRLLPKGFVSRDNFDIRQEADHAAARRISPPPMQSSASGRSTWNSPRSARRSAAGFPTAAPIRAPCSPAATGRTRPC